MVVVGGVDQLPGLRLLEAEAEEDVHVRVVVVDGGAPRVQEGGEHKRSASHAEARGDEPSAPPVRLEEPLLRRRQHHWMDLEVGRVDGRVVRAIRRELLG